MGERRSDVGQALAGQVEGGLGRGHPGRAGVVACAGAVEGGLGHGALADELLLALEVPLGVLHGGAGAGEIGLGALHVQLQVLGLELEQGLALAHPLPLVHHHPADPAGEANGQLRADRGHELARGAHGAALRRRGRGGQLGRGAGDRGGRRLIGGGGRFEVAHIRRQGRLGGGLTFLGRQGRLGSGFRRSPRLRRRASEEKSNKGRRFMQAPSGRTGLLEQARGGPARGARRAEVEPARGHGAAGLGERGLGGLGLQGGDLLGAVQLGACSYSASAAASCSRASPRLASAVWRSDQGLVHLFASPPGGPPEGAARLMLPLPRHADPGPTSPPWKTGTLKPKERKP